MLNESFGRLASAQTMKALRRTARSLFGVVYDGKPRITRRLVDEGGEGERYILRFMSPVLFDGLRLDGRVCGRTLAAAYAQAIEDMGERLREQADESYDEYSDGWLKDCEDDDGSIND